MQNLTGNNFKIDSDHRKMIVGNEPMIFHCHHYNTFLQRTIQDAAFIESNHFLVGAAAEMAFYQLTNYFQEMKIEGELCRKEIAQEIFKWTGCGVVDLDALSIQGGKTQTQSSHYSVAWVEKFGRSAQGVCKFMAGWIAGALAAVYDQQLGAYSVHETTCKAKGDACDTFVLKQEKANYSIYQTVGIGQISEHQLITPPESNVSYQAVFRAFNNMPIVSNDRGLLPALGVYLTRMYANYYNRISFEFLRALNQKIGDAGVGLASELLIEAGHVCAFNTFGGIVTSPEWDALVLPNLKTKEDWVHGITATVNVLGWGRWQIKSLSEQSAEFVIHDDYESCGYLAMYGQSDHDVSYLAMGAAAGIMNLVYIGNVSEGLDLSPTFYNQLFKSDQSYKIKTISSKAQGDETTNIVVYR